MIIPRYWAEARAQHREKGRQITVSRFGWSSAGEGEAQAHAEARAAEALRRVLAGERLDRRELKRAYHGAEGVPIREEIVAEHGETIITRNSYGALCLNTPDVLFADMDFAAGPPSGAGCGLALVLMLPAGWLAWLEGSWGLFVLLAIAAVLAGFGFVNLGHKLMGAVSGGPEKAASGLIEKFIATHRDWRLRLYRTPAGMRVVATHRKFSPDDAGVAELFRALQADPVYVKMCQRQQCFRARVSPKPWRIGIAAHLKPRPGVWPVRPEAMAARQTWIAAYEKQAAGYAACRFEREAGTGRASEEVRTVIELHDGLCRAGSKLPIA